jgi:hypothetical protein
MCVWFKLTISEAFVAQIEAKRGLLSLQAFTVQALIVACEGSPVEQGLRAEIEGLHLSLQCFGHSPAIEPPMRDAPQAGADDDQRLGW